MQTPPATPAVTIIMVSYNTRDLTLTAIRSCLDTTVQTPFRLVVLDNASSDGSADAIAEVFGGDPQVKLIRSDENLGFARANNVVAETADTEYLLLLNPDTECHVTNGVGAVDALMAFARETPRAGIWGGRTVFPDGSLNIASCWMRITPWSMVCRTFGLYSLFARSEFFNPEAMGDWARDSVREVDIVVGCFMLIRRDLWIRLGGFDLKYFMYGEEADLCLRAREIGCRPIITPTAENMHIVGAAIGERGDKIARVAKARATLIRDHWPAWQVPFGIGLMWLGMGLRVLGSAGLAALAPRRADRARMYRAIWAQRGDWLAGF